MNATAAILYARDGYDTSGPRLLGRQAAGEGFLKGFVRHGASTKVHCVAPDRATLDDFVRRVRPWATRDLNIVWVRPTDGAALGRVGTLYRPDLILEDHAWERRHRDQRAYSLCGVTHTIASRRALDAIGRLLIAPLQEWDALICTSRAVRDAVDRVHASFGEYLAERGGGVFAPRLQLPIIPLGVDTAAFAPEARPGARAALRTELGIAEDDLVVLYVGRLIHYAKAHPVPMYLALERAARRTGKKLHLIQAGWFEQEDGVERHYAEAAARLCPSVRNVVLDGRKPSVRATVWSAADLFVSLADNIQETFGITPIEAMAAGLPVVVSDWDGYKESVRDGVDGFRVPTLAPPPGSALDWSLAFNADLMNYSTFIANAAMVTSVDVEAAALAIARLIEDPALRRRMGDSGRERARTVYDWKVVIGAYEALWGELAERRARAEESARPEPGAVASPLCDDPFRLFAHYPTRAVDADTAFTLGGAARESEASFLRTGPLCALGRELRAPAKVVDALLAALDGAEPQSLSELERRFAPLPRAWLVRTLTHLAKLDLVRVVER